MSIQWGQVFAFPLRRPKVLLQLWLLHLLPILAIIPVFISGALTMFAALASAHSKVDALGVATAAMGLGTGLAYFVFGLVALFVAFYPLGYLIEVARSVAHQGETIPLPLGRWMVRSLKGIYSLLMIYASVFLCFFPPMLAFVFCLNPRDPHPYLGGLAIVTAWILMFVGFTLLPMRLAHSLNPLVALNPLSILGALRRGWLDYLVMMFTCTAFYFAFMVAYVATFMVAPFFLGASPIFWVLAVLFGMAQVYFILACAQAAGQFARLHCR